MDTVLKWMMALALIGANGAAMAQVTYTVNFMAESEKITGSITLAANSLGAITSGEIAGWSFSSVAGDPTQFSFNSGDAGADVICAAGTTQCGLTASASQITFTPIPQQPICCGAVSDIVFLAQNSTMNNALAIDGPGISQGPSPGVLITAANGLSGYGLAAGTTIATTKAPEIDPGSAASGLVLLIGSLVVLRGRNRRPSLRPSDARRPAALPPRIAS
jgi:hypothetical protein